MTAVQNIDQQRLEALGPAERIIQTLTTFVDHIYHGRPGFVRQDTSPIGVAWTPVTWKEEGGTRQVYSLSKIGRKSVRTLVGTLDGEDIKLAGRQVGKFRNPGLFPEATAFIYKQIAEVYKLDNEFAARWASWAFAKDHRDLKCVLCAFMLVQNRFGAPVVENGEILFHDDDFRAIGEAMCLLRAKSDFNPKMLLRVGDILRLEHVAKINRELGFGKSQREAATGRYHRVVQNWLYHRETNPKLLEGLVKAGFRKTVMALASRIGYKPASQKFFEILHWRQSQSKDGRRGIGLDMTLKQAESWVGLTEAQICEKIEKDKPNWKRIVGMLPKDVGVTRAIVVAAVESGCLSNQDMIIITPTLEELGLLEVPAVEKPWKIAVQQAENQRAANIAKNVRTKKAQEGLQEAVDKATATAIEKVTRNLRVYVIIDKSASMDGAIDRAKEYLKKFLGGFPLDRLHVAIFNTIGTELAIRSQNAAAVDQAFRGHAAGGGTSYAHGVLALSMHKPKADEDSLIVFVGDEEDDKITQLVQAVRGTQLRPVAFGLMKVASNMQGTGRGQVVRQAAIQLGIPCINIDTNMFDGSDPYAIPRIIQNLIAAAPVGTQHQPNTIVVARKTLIQEILETPLLQKPAWA